MKKILGFDSWTGGAHNFARLVPAFRDYGYELLLIHIGSWGGDTGRPVEEKIGELKVRDVSYYGGKSLLEILDIERPSAALFLSNDVFAHRAFNRYCRIKKIPTVHLYHGLVEIQSTQGDRMYKVNYLNQINYVLRRIPKALTKVWPLYASALYKSRSNFREWIRFCSDIANLTMGKYIPKAASDSRTNACAVFTPADISHATNKYGYTINDVHVVGNPDLAKFKLTDLMLGYATSRSTKANNEIVYIDTGLIYAGMVFNDSDDFLAHLVTLAKTLKIQGFNLAIKLHPDHHRTEFPAEVSKHDIRVIDDKGFVTALLSCRAAMVEPSTAALIPALLGLPLLMVAFGKLENQKYGRVLMDYPRSILITNSEMTESAIADIESGDSANLTSWITRNCGPLPSEEMPKRVAEVINRVVGN